MQSGDRLWCHLSEYQDDESQDQCARDDGILATDIDRNESHQCGGRQIDGVIAKQDQPDQAVRPLQERFRDSGCAMTGLGQVPQSITVEAHERGFSAGKEGRQKNQAYQ